MDDLRIPLIVAAGAFFLIVVWRVRPAFLSPERRRLRNEFREANARIEAAKTDAERVSALADAADSAAGSDLGSGRSVGLYLRAFRIDPSSAAIVERAIAALSKRRPRACESLLWRRLGSHPWSGPNVEASRAALRGLQGLYAKKLRSQVKANAIENALALLQDRS